MSNKKHILVISFSYQPFNAISAVRVSNFVKYMQNKDYIVHVITAKRYMNLNLSIAKNINTHYVWFPNADKLLDLSQKHNNNKVLIFFAKAFNKIFIRSVSNLPEGIGINIWRYLAFKRAKKIIKNNKIELIYTSSGPASSAIIGSKLSEKYNTSWIPEFRDLWSNPYYPENEKKFAENINIEKKTLKYASRIVTTTYYMQKILKDTHKKMTDVIYNGYDYFNKDEQKHNNKLIISYLGGIIPKRRDPSVLFQAIEELKNEKLVSENDISINFYGKTVSKINYLAKKFNVDNFVNVFPIVERKKSLEIQKNSDILLLLQWNNEKEVAIPGKLFEYIGMQKPILGICYDNGEINDILEETGTGSVINKLKQMKQFILFAVKEYKENKNLGFQFHQNKIEKYSRDFQNKKLEKIIQSF